MLQSQSLAALPSSNNRNAGSLVSTGSRGGRNQPIYNQKSSTSFMASRNGGSQTKIDVYQSPSKLYHSINTDNAAPLPRIIPTKMNGSQMSQTKGQGSPSMNKGLNRYSTAQDSISKQDVNNSMMSPYRDHNSSVQGTGIQLANRKMNQTDRSIERNMRNMNKSSFKDRAKVSEFLGDMSFDQIYPQKNVTPLIYNKLKDPTIIWKNDPRNQGKTGRFSMWDQIVKQDKKDCKQGPNQYFKTDKNSDSININIQMERTLQEEKKTFGKISQLPRISLFDKIMKDEKKKVGPNHYKSVENGLKMCEDKQGAYRGLSLTSSDMLCMVAHQKAHAMTRPQPGHYKPNLELTENRTQVANLNRDKSPQRGPPRKPDKGPSPVSYNIEKKEERKILSTKQRSQCAMLGHDDHSKNAKHERFIDIHKKRKAFMPPLTKYNFTGAQKARYISTGPSSLKLAHKR